MKKQLLFLLLCCSPIFFYGQIGTYQFGFEDGISNWYKTDGSTDTNTQNFSQKRFKAEIPYVNTSTLKSMHLDDIRKKVNEDQVKLPIEEQVYLNSKFELVTYSIPKICITKIDIQYFQKKNYN
ncbi:hypothetical protein [Kordia sp.]|uniref:hypothetical protein n=1 Tax=Kordia sp. TaxID=1965332 RepID=UPI003D6B6ADC